MEHVLELFHQDAHLWGPFMIFRWRPTSPSSRLGPRPPLKLLLPAVPVRACTAAAPPQSIHPDPGCLDPAIARRACRGLHRWAPPASSSTRAFLDPLSLLRLLVPASSLALPSNFILAVVCVTTTRSPQGHSDCNGNVIGTKPKMIDGINNSVERDMLLTLFSTI